MDREYLTPQGLKKLEEELDHLKNVARLEVARRLHDAMADGEIEENAEYEAARQQQSMIEARIAEIENILANAVIIESGGPVDEVRLGVRVTIADVESGKREKYTLVGSTEADPESGFISHESPLGRALMGHKVNDIVTVYAPDGELKYKIIRIERN